MKTRNTQVFVAPGDENAPLSVEPSAWHSGRWVKLPYEHWALIIRFAKGVDPDKAKALDRLSNVGASRVRSQSTAELRSVEKFLQVLSLLLPSALPLVEAATKDIPEDHPNEEHARMCDAVEAVMAAGAKSGEPIRSWVE